MSPQEPPSEPTTRPEPCAHRWIELGSDAVYCWRRQCERCGIIEGEEHTMTFVYSVVGCCVYAYGCEKCGYLLH